MRLITLVFGLLVMAMPAQAQDEKSAPVPNPHIAIMTEKATELAKNLTDEEAASLGLIRENFGYIRSIGVARKTVADAVGQCGEKNPDMKAAMDERFKDWNDGISAALAKQEKNLDAAVSDKNFSDPEAVSSYLDSIDDMANYSDNQISKNIVTTPEACQNLVGSMDETSTVILGLITDLKWPGDESGATAP